MSRSVVGGVAPTGGGELAQLVDSDVERAQPGIVSSVEESNDIFFIGGQRGVVDKRRHALVSQYCECSFHFQADRVRLIIGVELSSF